MSRNGFSAVWAESGVCRALDRIGPAGGRVLRESNLWRLLKKDSPLTRDWEESHLCLLLTGLVNLPGDLIARLRRKAPGVWDNSLVLRGLTALSERSDILAGVLMLIMLLAPHAVWNNLYALIGILVMLFLHAIGRREGVNRLEPKAAGPWVGLFLLGICRALLASAEIDLSLRFFAFHLTAMLLMLLTVSSIRDYKQAHRLVWIAVAGLTAAAFYGCVQAAMGVEIVASQQDMVLNAGMPGRIYSFFDNPNNFAEILVLLLPLDLALILNASSPRERLLAILCFLPCIAALGLTYSRSSWIGFVLALMVFCAFYNWKLLPAFIALGFCCVPLLPKTIFRRILTIGNTSDTSAIYRIAIYEASGKLMKDYWGGGVGLGSDILTKTFRDYPAMYDGNFPIHTHNNYLQVWAEMGLFGLLPFLGTLAHSLKNGVRQVFGAEKRLKAMLSAALGSFAGILVISFAEYTWFYPRNLFFFWFIFGLIAACVKLAKGEEKY